MIRFRVFAILTVAVALGFAPAPFPKKDRSRSGDDYQNLQGIWKQLHRGNDNNKGPLGKARIKGKRWTFINVEGSDGPSYDLTLDQTVSPRALEWRSPPGSSSPSSFLASYKIEGKILTIIYVSGSIMELHKRPTDFSSTGSNQYVYEFERRE